MTTLIRVFDESGRETRRCDARCHRADPSRAYESRCLCEGWLRGVETGGRTALDVKPEFLNLVRERIKLKPGEHVHMRIGA